MNHPPYRRADECAGVSGMPWPPCGRRAVRTVLRFPTGTSRTVASDAQPPIRCAVGRL